MSAIDPQIAPSETRVVVIGGGIIGAVTALEFAERGIPVVLYEKGGFGREQSGLNFGWCRQLGRDVRELPLSIHALELWGEMNARIQGETGFRRAGIVHVASSANELLQFRDRIKSIGAAASRIGLECVNRDVVATLLPGATKNFIGGLYCKTDGRAEPHLATRAIVSGAEKAGALLRPGCAVRGFEISNNKIAGVITEKGATRCDTVVIASGIWSRHLLRSIGIALPQLFVSETLLKTSAIDLGHGACMTTGRIAHRPALSGGYVIAHESNTITDIIPASFRYAGKFLPVMTKEFKRLHFRIGGAFIREATFPKRWPTGKVSPFEHLRQVQPQPSSRRVISAFEEMRDLFPALRASSIESMWSGYIDVMPDAIPVISAVPQVQGLWLATGFSGHGFGVAPAAGRLLADMISGEDPFVDPTPFSFDRFSSAGVQHSAHKRPTI